MWIKLTRIAGITDTENSYKDLYNTDNIISIKQSSNGTVIHTVRGGWDYVLESFDEVESKLREIE
jgi:hypothetical protein